MNGMKSASRWYSPRLEQDVSLVRWGHFGQPVLLFPTAGAPAPGDRHDVQFVAH